MKPLWDVSRHSHVGLPGHLLLLVLYVMDFNSCEELVEILRSTVCGFVPPPGVLQCSWLVPAPWEVLQVSRNTSWIAVLITVPESSIPLSGQSGGFGHWYGHGAWRELSCVSSPKLSPVTGSAGDTPQDRVVSPAPSAAPALGTLDPPCPGLCEQGDERHGLP